MKPRTVVTLAVSFLLAASVLCIGARHAIDANRKLVSSGSTGGTASHPPGKSEQMPKAVNKASESIGPQALEKKLRGLLAIVNESDRTRALLELTATFKADDWQRALKALDNADGSGRGGMLCSMILSGWTEVDPRKALVYSTEHKAWEGQVIGAWTVTDSEAALAFLESPEGMRLMDQGLWVVPALDALGKDLPRIARLLAAISGHRRAILVERAHPDFSSHDAATIKAWVADLDPTVKQPALDLLLSNLTGVEAKLALAQDFPDELGPEKYGSIYHEWMKSDEPAAIASLESLEPGPQHQAALRGVLLGLNEKRKRPELFALARRWPDQVSDSLLADLILDSGLSNPPLTLGEIPRIKDEGLQLNRYRMTLGMWFKSNPEAASKWLAENEVPQQIRKEFEGK